MYYIATMEPFGAETKRKIERHRQMRAGKGFQTIECYTELSEKAKALKGTHASVLLECMSNLTANELYRRVCQAEHEGKEAEAYGAAEKAVEAVWQGMMALCEACDQIVVVTNEVFSECSRDSKDMVRYKQVLSEINCKMAKMADRVTEVVYGIPVEIGGK